MKEKSDADRWLSPEYLKDQLPTLEALFVRKERVVGANLKGIPVSFGECPISLVSANFINAVLEDSDASHAAMSCSFGRALLTRVNFAATFFDTCNFYHASFVGCRFDACKFDSPFLDDARFVQCTFRGAKWVSRQMQAFGGRRVVFEECDFGEVLFDRLQFRACKFRTCSFGGTRFRRCLLKGVKFEGEAPLPEAFENCTM